VHALGHQGNRENDVTTVQYKEDSRAKATKDERLRVSRAVPHRQSNSLGSVFIHQITVFSNKIFSLVT
jgi:hypothetical protein